MDVSALASFPDEILETFVDYLPPESILAFGAACKRCNNVTREHPIWMQYCRQEWRFWEPQHELESKLREPHTLSDWRQIYIDRRRTDRWALRVFTEMLQTQQSRMQRIENIAQLGYDVKDLMIKLRDGGLDDIHSDVLARRYYANIVIGRIHRMTALRKWSELQKGEAGRLEEAIGAFDLFILAYRKGDLGELSEEFDRIANVIRSRYKHYDDFSIRQKATDIAHYLRGQGLVGNPNIENYHALRNNFLSIALFDELHTSLPLQSAVIYCSVARRIGLNASPTNTPGHVYVVVEAPINTTLDGKNNVSKVPERLYMNPWGSGDELQHNQFTASFVAASNLAIALRTSQNLQKSVQDAYSQQHGTIQRSGYPDVNAAWYSRLWSLVLLNSSVGPAMLEQKQRFQLLADHMRSYFPEDVGLLERFVMPIFSNEKEYTEMTQAISEARALDQNIRIPRQRAGGRHTKFKIGQFVQHKRYGYHGIIVGWDHECTSDVHQRQQAEVEILTQGDNQPFYTAVLEDNSRRYVAEENIVLLLMTPTRGFMELAGRWFKRWDVQKKVFVSNIRDEYPDD